jgi:putative spermidine/putrescine transport system substrate-binding protein
MRKQFILGTVVAIAAAMLPVVAAETSSAATAAKIDYSKCTDLKSCGGMDALVAAAKKEGKLNVITLPRDWANYGEAMDLFSKAFGIKITDDNPDGSSAYEIQTVRTAPASKVPDAVDVGITYGADNANLFSPYKVQNWKDITPTYKDANGRWYGDYAGVIALSYDTSIPKAPTSFNDLKDPAFKNMVAIGGDPSGAQEALMSVFAANLANGGTTANVQTGIDYFKAMKTSGNFVTVLANGQNLLAGAYKVSFSWSFNGPGAVATAAKAGKTIKYVIPSDAVIKGTPYIMAIPFNAPHPAAARLWTEFLYSENKGKGSTTIGSTKGMTGSKIFAAINGGQNIWIAGGALPIEYDAMVAKGTNAAAPAGYGIPAGAKIVTPSPADQDAAKALLKAQWPAIAGN